MYISNYYDFGVRYQLSKIYGTVRSKERSILFQKPIASSMTVYI